MKKHGRFLSLILAVMLAAFMLVSASGLEIFIIASSDEYLGYGTSASYLETIKVMQGYGDGDLHLEEPIQRYQAALFFARLVTGVTDETLWGEGASEKYSDVPQYGNVIDFISEMDIIRGYGNATFGYNDGIRYQDMCAMLVRVLGYETEEMLKTYPLSYVFKVKELGLELKNVMPDDYLNRGQTAQMVYDALVTKIEDPDGKRYEELKKLIDTINNKGTTAPTTPTTPVDTYLERNFEVSSAMYFKIVATENYSAYPGVKADKDHIKVALLVPDEKTGIMLTGSLWSFPIEGTPTADVSEADLIGKCLKVVFDRKNPTDADIAAEVCSIIYADFIDGTTFENLGELSYIKFDDKVEKLTLGSNVIKVADINKFATIWKQSEDETSVVTTMSVSDLANAMKVDTYFALECYDYNKDGNYDSILYKPYSFAQYAERTYSGTKYVMLGRYYANGTFDRTNDAEKTADNTTYFVEHFLGKSSDLNAGYVASRSYTKYTPSDTSLKISDYVGQLSSTVKVTGDAIAHGDFMIYYYNPLVNRLEVVENLGSYQVGEISGYKTAARTVNLDGDVTSVGISGAISGNTGLLVGDTPYYGALNTVKYLIAGYKKGEPNTRFIEYDGKIIYLESYGEKDYEVGSEFVVVDIEETLKKHKKDNSKATDISFADDYAIVSALDLATGEFYEIKVESLTYKVGTTETTLSFDNWKDKQAMKWTDDEVYQTFKKQGVIYATLDEDADDKHELYAYSVSDISKFNIVGAKALVSSATTPSVYFTYNKSTSFVADNICGVSTERVTTNDNTVSVVIAQDGYVMVKGKLGNQGVDENKLWLSKDAVILKATDNQITIYDPLGFVGANASQNVYHKTANSIWSKSASNTSDSGLAFYILLENTVYNGSSVMENADGTIAENADGKRLYTHEYKGLYNLLTGATENVTLVTTSATPIATEVINSNRGVICYEAEKNKAELTTFDIAFVKNDKYHYGGFSWLAAKDRIGFVSMDKDQNGDGRYTGNEKGVSIYYNSDDDKVYNAVKGIKVTFIDLDAGAAVDPDEFCFDDAYVFYQDTESNRKSYMGITLEDRTEDQYAKGTYPIKRHIIDKKDVSGNIGNGRVTNLTAGKVGLIGTQGFFRWNGWSDYLIPPVNEDGDTVWTYEGSKRISVTYFGYVYYDFETEVVEGVIIRVGVDMGQIAAGATIPALKPEPTQPTENSSQSVINNYNNVTTPSSN